MGYNIRFANKEDIESIMEFIDKFWKKNHILARDRELFEWQYGGIGDGLNIVIGLDDDGTIQGMLGFVPYSHSEDKDIALALWKANPSANFLGIHLIKYLMEEDDHRKIVCPGINLKTTKKIYEHIGMTVGTMLQWYRLSQREEYFIAKISDKQIAYYDNEKQIDLKEVNTINELVSLFDFGNLEFLKGVPCKSAEYIDHRYFKHPIYKYKVFFAENEAIEEKAILVFRIQECNSSKALRLIDCIGNCEIIKRVTKNIDNLMNQYGCEYVDTYETGVDDGIFISAGWKKVEEDGNIIPDYFAPFEQRKVDIHYSTSDEKAILFKGDGDQDRPN